MPAGVAQALRGNAGPTPERHTVLAGCGPFIYLVAWQLLQADVELTGIIVVVDEVGPRA